MTNEILTTLHPDHDPDTNLYPNIKKDNIPSKSIDRNKLGDDVNSLLNSINELHPSGVDTSTNILAKTSNQGIWIGSDTGYWYYWDGTQYVDGGIYQAMQINYQEYTNLIDYNDCIFGYYGSNGSLITSYGFSTYFISVSVGSVLYLNYKPSGNLICSLLNSNKEFIQTITISNTNVITIPNVTGVAYLGLPINVGDLDEIFISNVEIPFNTNVNNSKTIFGAFTGRYDIFKLYDAIKDNNENDETYTLTYTKNINSVGVKLTSLNASSSAWFSLSFNTNYLKCINNFGIIMLAKNNEYLIGLDINGGNLFRFNNGGSGYTILHTFNISNNEQYLFNYYINENGKVLVINAINNSIVLEFYLTDYLTLDNSYTLTFGWIFFRHSAYIKSYDEIEIFDLTPNSAIKVKTTPIDINNHWNGKTWYAYGTSITSVAQGKYVSYLAQMSGMSAVNKGIPGGGIGNFGVTSTGQVYNAICNITDGKLNADLITLECGANDCDANVPLGTIYDTGQSTLCGCFNDCIRYLQENTNAQIVVIPSIPHKQAIPNATDKYFEFQFLMKQMCFINRVEFIDGNDNLGYGKIYNNNNYTEDTIHQTNLGGYNFAKSIWAKLKDVPLFYTSIPE